ncbi:hypothetical protein [Legionella sp. W05-934-2]|jgi:hypothetical protein|uniref:hypothetical protein n=1 Tax=Legionella sp. W05-934-2 TaxID=1198649 RepID=UPI0034622F3B
MKRAFIFFLALIASQTDAEPLFVKERPLPSKHYQINGPALCNTAKNTLAYLNQGHDFDPRVIHEGVWAPIPVSRIKKTLQFICEHQHELNNPQFVKENFDFLRWYPDMNAVQRLKKKNTLLAHLPNHKILMTKYYVHKAQGKITTNPPYSYALHGLPKDETSLTLEQASNLPNLLRFQHGKQDILKGALKNKPVPVLAYLTRDDLETALLQGTVVITFDNKPSQSVTFNVHRCNNIPYDKALPPYEQQRYWYFKKVNGIKGYGKDANHKITVNTEVTFAGDLQNFGLGKLLMIQYPSPGGKIISQAGLLADTGGAFENNPNQIDYLSGSFAGNQAFYQAMKGLPDYVNAYIMVLKKELT